MTPQSSCSSYALSKVTVLLQMCDDTVRVALRIRPLVESELQKGCQVCLDTVPGEPQVRIGTTDKAFTYNYVFPPDVGQEDFYNSAIKGLVANTFQGKSHFLTFL